jgi:enoyl-CoA hydratase/carnithine racemase
MDEVLFERPASAIALITLNRPAQRNAINAGMRQGLFDAWARFEADRDLRVAILTGAGEAFCAGADLKEMAETGLGVLPPNFLPILGEAVQLTKPVIAAVNGAAFAGGFLFAQMCDLAVASRGARFGITEARVGRGMPWAAPLIDMVGKRVMMELLVTGQPISAQRAYEVGLVNHVVEPGELMPRALDLAGCIAENAPLTVAAAKEMVGLSTEMGRTAALAAARHIFDRVYRSADAQEGPAAFRDKRKPRWRGE